MLTPSQLLEDHVPCHDEVQMDCFIVGGRHPWAQYRQALRELHSRTDVLRGHYNRLEDMAIDCEELKDNLARDCYASKFARRRDELKLRRLASSLQDAHDYTKHIEREYRRFYAHALALRAYCKDTYGELTDERKAALDHEMWEHDFKSQAAALAMIGQRPHANLIKNIVGFSKSSREKMLDALHPSNANKLIEWYTGEDKALPPAYMEKALAALPTVIDKKMLAVAPEVDVDA